jgi:hypothetical protein
MRYVYRYAVCGLNTRSAVRVSVCLLDVVSFYRNERYALCVPVRDSTEEKMGPADLVTRPQITYRYT